MSKLKKILLMVLSLVLVAAMSIGGTVAYLQDEESDVNVMTLGSVYIRQNEEQRVDPAKNGTLTDADIEDFKQAKPIYPYVDVNLNGAMNDDYEEIKFPDGNTYKLFIGDNAIDKLVSVTNTGKSDAYVRTIIALEAPTDKIDLSFNAKNAWKMDKTASSYSIEVDGVKYDLFVCVYNNPLKPGETTPYSLLQIILDGTATNEDAAAYGDTYDVLVLSQAVQTAGFANAQTALNTGFGVVDADSAAEWFKGVLTALPEGIPVATVADVTESVSTITWNDQLGLIPTDPNQQLDVVYKYECPDEALCDPKYDDWYCDFYVSVSEDIDAGQIVLGGNYGTFGWIGFDAPAVSGNTEIALLASAFGGELVGRGAENDPYWTYANIKDLVDTFLCGVAEATGATQSLSGVTFTVNLSLTNPADSSEYYNVNTVTYTFK